MLLGEHAVVHGRACLVTAMDARLHMVLTPTSRADDTFTVHAPDVSVEHMERPLRKAFLNGQPLAHGTRFIESALAVFQAQYGIPCGLHIETHNDFASTKGLGSSSAVVACTLFGLSQLFGVSLTLRQLFNLGLSAVLNVQRTGSGFDLAAAVYGGTLLYENRDPRRTEALDASGLPLIVAYAGVKADTPAIVRRVTDLLAQWPAAMTSIFDTMHQLVLDGCAAIQTRDWAKLGDLMNMQHGLAHAIGVDIPETANLVFAARQAGALGAKLSGAGGGDCIIALAEDAQCQQVTSALESAGGEIVRIKPHAPGVRLDTGKR